MGRQFTEVLDELNAGAFTADCGERLEELLKAIKDTGGKGTLTVELAISPDGDSTLMVHPTVKIKKPGRRRPGTVMFKGKDGLSIDNPNQPSLFDASKVRDITTSRQPVTAEI